MVPDTRPSFDELVKSHYFLCVCSSESCTSTPKRSRILSLPLPTLLLPFSTLTLSLSLSLWLHLRSSDSSGTLLLTPNINHLDLPQPHSPRGPQTGQISTSSQLPQPRNQPSHLRNLVRPVLETDPRGGVVGFQYQCCDGCCCCGSCGFLCCGFCGFCGGWFCFCLGFGLCVLAGFRFRAFALCRRRCCGEGVFCCYALNRGYYISPWFLSLECWIGIWGGGRGLVRSRGGLDKTCAVPGGLSVDLSYRVRVGLEKESRLLQKCLGSWEFGHCAGRREAIPLCLVVLVLVLCWCGGSVCARVNGVMHREMQLEYFVGIAVGLEGVKAWLRGIGGFSWKAGER